MTFQSKNLVINQSAGIQYEEAVLIEKLQQRDQHAFSYLYDHYAVALNSIIFRIVGDTTMTEDLLQDTFVKIWRNMSMYESSKGRLFTWMAIVARNLAIDLLKSRQHRNQRHVYAFDNLSENVKDDTFTSERFDALGLIKQLAKLRPDYKAVIELAYLKGYKQEEVALYLGIPIGTVKTRLRNALADLKKIFYQPVIAA